MRISILNESEPNEARVAVTPESVSKLSNLGLEVWVESGAGQGAHISNQAFQEAGATVSDDRSALLRTADVLLQVQPGDQPQQLDELKQLKREAIVIGVLSPFQAADRVQRYVDQQLTTFALELMPRISRAQNMDVLSSQSNLAGYKAVLEALTYFRRIMPMMMTAAGAIPPAKVLVLGAGVAGLQAIATAKRLGAVVSAFDVRPEVKEQVESLGAKFVEVKTESESDVATEGGYVKEIDEDYQKRQRERIHQAVADSDIVITTALLMGRPAPELITQAMVEDMKSGSVIVDMAIAGGGNCPLTQRGEAINHQGVTIIGYDDLPSRLSSDASHLFARNAMHFITHLVNDTASQSSMSEIPIDREDEIIAGTLLTFRGEIVHPWMKL
ncbi:MAG: Re/Si-specific NAD(P)(+) transhydrogenase subunit alpha [Gammaproteobacteria bacterium]|nr:Re/Si-specific NAD(P)(+) transhydrogenase subunit alpha [Gammaproteobacteria bacterium]